MLRKRILNHANKRKAVIDYLCRKFSWAVKLSILSFQGSGQHLQHATKEYVLNMYELVSLLFLCFSSPFQIHSINCAKRRQLLGALVTDTTRFLRVLVILYFVFVAVFCTL